MPKIKKAPESSESATDNLTTISDIAVDNSLGPLLFERDESGLLKNVQYL